jgi:hypothetical protein
MSSVPARLKAIGMFLWDFVIGDDWRVAAGVAAGLAITYGVAQAAAAWWVMPVVVALLVPMGLVRGVRKT